MEYLDFELAIGAGDGITYPVNVVRSPAGESRASTQFPFDELELKNKLQGLQIALLKSGSNRRDVIQPEEKASIEDFGGALFSTLFPEEIRSCYRLSRQKAKQEGKGLRLRLRIEAPELASMPWEYLYDESEGDFVCLSTDTPIVRYLELDRPSEPLEFAPPMRILGMVASPEDRPQLDVDREKQRIAEALSDLEARGLVEMTWLEGSTWQDLQRAMRQGPWHMFHFVGHGGFDATSGEGMLALCDENNQTYRLSAVMLGRLLADHKSLRLVVLNACEGAQASDSDIFSSTASVLIRRGVPAVIAMQFEITDRAAIQFVHGFVESLAEGLPVDAAVSEARKAISLAASNSVEWGTPVLHMRSPDGRLFAPEKVTQQTAVADASNVSTLPTLARDQRKLAMFAGVGVVLVVLLGWLFLRPSGPETVPFTGPDQIASIALMGGGNDVAQGSSLDIRAVVMDSLGREIDPEGLRDFPLIWDPGDVTKARISTDPTTYSIQVEGLRPGKALICVAFADTTLFARTLGDKYMVNVLPGEGGPEQLYREYIAAVGDFTEPDIDDEALLSTYKRLLDDRRSELESALEPRDLDRFALRTAQLEAITSRYKEVDEFDQTNNYSVVEELHEWQSYIAMADSVRKSTARQQAAAAVDSLQGLLAEHTSLVSFHLCESAGRSRECPESWRSESFRLGQSVYFTAAVRLFSDESIRWEWLNESGSVIEEGAASLRTSNAYNTYSNFKPEAVGTYQLRMYNAQDHMIGRRTFVVQ